MKKINIRPKEKIHFIGIGGIGMSGLAQVMQRMGFNVQGSDLSNSKNVERCKKIGIKVFSKHSKENLKDYWGYDVKERSNLFSLLSSWEGNIILTSKKGKIFTESDAKKIAKLNESVLIVFGTTKSGIHEILGSDIKKIQNSKIFNFFPNQATQTVRLEEAILGVLSVINILNYDYIE